MNVEYSHRPNYYFFAHKLVLFLQNYVKQHPNSQSATFNLSEIYDLFGHDRASSTTNLEGILNIVDEYTLETAEGDQPLIQSHRVHINNHILSLTFNSSAIESIVIGKMIVNPKAA